MQQIVNHRIYGESGETVFIVHGIFGMLDNWQYHAKLLSSNYRVIAVDVRNHGKSFHTDSMTYEEMAMDLIDLADHLGINTFHLLGHSMGGKIAMKCAEMFPDRIRNLIIVDIAPKSYPPGHVPYFKAFLSLPLHSYSSRAEVEEAFEEFVPEKGVRLFLLKNLEIDPDGGYRTKSNMIAIKKFYEEIIGDLELKEDSFLRKATFISGANSPYLKEEDKPKIVEAFPKSVFVEVSKAGHWVHAENPQEFYEKLQIALHA